MHSDFDEIFLYRRSDNFLHRHHHHHHHHHHYHHHHHSWNYEFISNVGWRAHTTVAFCDSSTVCVIAAEGDQPFDLLTVMYIIIAILIGIAVIVIIVLLWYHRRQMKAAAGETDYTLGPTIFLRILSKSIFKMRDKQKFQKVYEKKVT